MILVAGNMTRMGIFAGVSLGGGVKWECGYWRRQFLAICYTLSAGNWLQNEWPWM